MLEVSRHGGKFVMRGIDSNFRCSGHDREDFESNYDTSTENEPAKHGELPSLISETLIQLS